MNIPVKVINLARSTARREAFVRSNPGLAYEFFEGVDGQKLTDQQLDDSGLFIPPLHFPGMGAFGAAMSHLKVWELAIAGNHPVTVAEDDAIFRSDFAQASMAVIARLPEDWDFILWGWNFDSLLAVRPMKGNADSALSVRALPGLSPVVMLFSQEELRRNLDTFRQMTEPAAGLGLEKCFGTPAYTISPAGARKFKEQCFPMRDMAVWFPGLNAKVANTGIDIAMNAIYARTNSYVAFPPLVVTPNERASSTIQK